MKIVATADLHGAFPKIPSCDLLLVGGDVCPVEGSHEVYDQRHWLRTKFHDWLTEQMDVADEIVWIAGNHDFACEDPSFARYGPDLPGNYLIDEMFESKDGFRVYGSPWVPNLTGWAFYKPDVKFLDQSEQMPEADCYLLHGPPYGIMDGVDPQHPHVGAPYIDRAVIKHKIPHVIFGHIHEGYGLVDRGPTRYRNVAHMNGIYEPVNRPHVFEV